MKYRVSLLLGLISFCISFQSTLSWAQAQDGQFALARGGGGVGNGGDGFGGYIQDVAKRILKTYRMVCLSSPENAVCGYIKPFEEAVIRAHVSTLPIVLEKKDLKPRDFINDGEDRIIVSTERWEEIGVSNEGVIRKIRDIIHEYMSLAKSPSGQSVESSDQFDRATNLLLKLFQDSMIDLRALLGEEPLPAFKMFETPEITMIKDGKVAYVRSDLTSATGFCVSKGYKKSYGGESSSSLGDGGIQSVYRVNVHGKPLKLENGYFLTRVGCSSN